MDERQVGTKPEKEYRLARWAKPADRAYPADTPRIIEMKREFLDYLQAGLEIREAARAAWPEDNALQFVNYHRSLDPVFDEQVENVLNLQRKDWLPQLESNMFKQATKDNIGAGRLAFDIAKVLAPEVYGKKPKQDTAPKQPKTPADYGISEWFAAPVPLEAEFRELDEPEPE